MKEEGRGWEARGWEGVGWWWREMGEEGVCVGWWWRGESSELPAESSGCSMCLLSIYYKVTVHILYGDCPFTVRRLSILLLHGDCLFTVR